MREGGLEPPHPYGHRNLNPARLPIPPLARGTEHPAEQYGSASSAACDGPIACRPVGLRDLERGLERSVEGVFARVFRSGLKPIEIGRRATRSLDDGRSVDVHGRTVVPNHVTVALSPADQERLADIHDSLVRELSEAIRQHARYEGYHFLGPVAVEMVVSPRLRTGMFDVRGRFREAEGGAGPGSLLLPTGERVTLGEYVVTFGRLPESTIVLADTNASRNHAEIRPYGDGYRLIDLGSTNGTLVNGAPIADQILVDGDEIEIGSTFIVFEAS